MQISKHRESCYDRQAGHYDSIIRINMLRSDSLEAYTCGGLYYSAEPLPMGVTLPHTREKNRVEATRCSSLAQARSRRPDERSCLAQATGSRLGEPTTVGPRRFHDISLSSRNSSSELKSENQGKTSSKVDEERALTELLTEDKRGEETVF
ncbi:hypothetical protein DEO72_LG10g2961 [Vigna unguiculata]|uniref:Uncharacterized protein n=1 Tax=Vigna unguiculata TaxID=3917 RepID=A0A4D6NHV6_VIGUN|nr:hypothetical protein DEO72_LG10g2961 [Vigna unguiculata]